MVMVVMSMIDLLSQIPINGPNHPHLFLVAASVGIDSNGNFGLDDFVRYILEGIVIGIVVGLSLLLLRPLLMCYGGFLAIFKIHDFTEFGPSERRSDPASSLVLLRSVVSSSSGVFLLGGEWERRRRSDDTFEGGLNCFWPGPHLSPPWSFFSGDIDLSRPPVGSNAGFVEMFSLGGTRFKVLLPWSSVIVIVFDISRGIRPVNGGDGRLTVLLRAGTCIFLGLTTAFIAARVNGFQRAGSSGMVSVVQTHRIHIFVGSKYRPCERDLLPAIVKPLLSGGQRTRMTRKGRAIRVESEESNVPWRYFLMSCIIYLGAGETRLHLQRQEEHQSPTRLAGHHPRDQQMTCSMRESFEFGAYVQFIFSFFPFRTFKENRTSGLANANSKRRALIACKVLPVLFKAVCFLTERNFTNTNLSIPEAPYLSDVPTISPSTRVVTVRPWLSSAILARASPRNPRKVPPNRERSSRDLILDPVAALCPQVVIIIVYALSASCSRCLADHDKFYRLRPVSGLLVSQNYNDVCHAMI
ncbi:hypothetical protein KCU88_g398, partial [Aureobasidium melanogenum]